MLLLQLLNLKTGKPKSIQKKQQIFPSGKHIQNDHPNVVAIKVGRHLMYKMQRNLNQEDLLNPQQYLDPSLTK